MTLLTQLNQLPPPLVRLLAHPVTDKQIVAKSGLSESTVRRLSKQSSWVKSRQRANYCGLEQASKFLAACGIEVHVTIPAIQALEKALANGKTLQDLPGMKLRYAKRRLKRLMKILEI